MASQDSCWWQRQTSYMNYDPRIILMTSAGLRMFEGLGHPEGTMSCFINWMSIWEGAVTEMFPTWGRACCVWRSLRNVCWACQMLVMYQLTCVLLAVCDRALQLQERQPAAESWMFCFRLKHSLIISGSERTCLFMSWFVIGNFCFI